MTHPFVHAIVRECRFQHITVEELARRTHHRLSVKAIQQILQEEYPFYSPDLVDWLADAFNLKGYQRRSFFEQAGLTLEDQGDRVFYRVLIQLCQERRLTTEQMAQRTVFHPTHVDAFLSGEICPEPDHLEVLAEALELQGEELVTFFHAGGYSLPEEEIEDDESISFSEPLQVFYCYAQEDQALRDTLDKHLGLLKRRGMIVTWHNREIAAGTDWEKEIAEHLQSAHLILLLISPDFIASDYCYGIEMQKALALHEQGSARIVPILLRPVDWRGAPFAHLQVLPTGARPITSAAWSSLDEACYDVALRLRTIVEEW